MSPSGVRVCRAPGGRAPPLLSAVSLAEAGTTPPPRPHAPTTCHDFSISPSLPHGRRLHVRAFDLPCRSGTAGRPCFSPFVFPVSPSGARPRLMRARVHAGAPLLHRLHHLCPAVGSPHETRAGAVGRGRAWKAGRLSCSACPRPARRRPTHDPHPHRHWHCFARCVPMFALAHPLAPLLTSPPLRVFDEGKGGKGGGAERAAHTYTPRGRANLACTAPGRKTIADQSGAGHGKQLVSCNARAGDEGGAAPAQPATNGAPPALHPPSPPPAAPRLAANAPRARSLRPPAGSAQ